MLLLNASGGDERTTARKAKRDFAKAERASQTGLSAAEVRRLRRQGITMSCTVCKPIKAFKKKQPYKDHKSIHKLDPVCGFCNKVFSPFLIRRHKRMCKARPQDAATDTGAEDVETCDVGNEDEEPEIRASRRLCDAAVKCESDSDSSGCETLSSPPSPCKQRQTSTTKPSEPNQVSEQLIQTAKKQELDSNAQQIISSLENQARVLAEMLADAKRAIAIVREERARDREQWERVRVERECELDRIARERRHLSRQPHLVQVGNVFLLDRPPPKRRNTMDSSRCA